jgi:hypothetical protein
MYGLEVAVPSEADRLIEATTLNHFYRWQEQDFAQRSGVTFEDFKRRLGAGEDMSYTAVDTSRGRSGAVEKRVNPAMPFTIELMPYARGFIVDPGNTNGPAFSIDTTINDDGSVVLRVPFSSKQLNIPDGQKGGADVETPATSDIITCLVDMGIPKSFIY